MAGLIALAVALRLVFFFGLQGRDDRVYIFYANYFVTHQQIPLGEHTTWIGRIGHWLPMAGVMSIMGSSEIASVVYSMICSLLGVIVVLRLGLVLFERRVARAAAILFAFFPLEIFYSSTVYVDIVVGFFQLLSLFFFLLHFRSSSPRSTIFYAGLALGWAYLCRETALFALVPLGLIAIGKRLSPDRAVLFCAGALMIFVVECVFWHVQTGDALYRYHAATAQLDDIVEMQESVSTESSGTWIPSPKPTGRWRSNYSIVDAALMFVTNEEFGAFYIIFLPFLVVMTLRGDTASGDLRIWTACLLLLLLFFPAYFPKYTLPRDPRFYACVTGPAILCLVSWMDAWRWRRSVVAGLLISGIAAVAVTAESRWYRIPRMLYDFQRSHQNETLWVSPHYAAFIAVYSGMKIPSSTGVHLFEQRATSGTYKQYTLYAPTAQVAQSPGDIRRGFVALERPRVQELPPAWQETARLRPRPSLLTRVLVRCLNAVGVPGRFQTKLLPDGGKVVTVFRVRNE